MPEQLDDYLENVPEVREGSAGFRLAMREFWATRNLGPSDVELSLTPLSSGETAPTKPRTELWKVETTNKSDGSRPFKPFVVKAGSDETISYEAAGYDHIGQSHLVPGFYCDGLEPDTQDYLDSFIALEAIDGVNILHLLRHWSDHPVELRLLVASLKSRVVSCLHRNHGMGLGDIKPSNFMLNTSGYLKAIDLESHYLFDDPEDSWEAFTPAYAAPEQMAGALPSDRTDVFCLGSSYFQMFSEGGITLPEALLGGEKIHGQAQYEAAWSDLNDASMVKAVNDWIIYNPMKVILHEMLRSSTKNRPSMGVVDESLSRTLAQADKTQVGKLTASYLTGLVSELQN